MKILSLNSETHIPILGFGTWKLQGEECTTAVSNAIEVGYRHIDTADAYENHKDIAQALKSSGISRKELFLTTKVWRTDLSKQKMLDACYRALEELNIDYIDLYLIHWPNRKIPLLESIETLQLLKEKKLIKAIGVSNYTIHHLEDTLKTGIEITCNQVEFHPTWNQKELREFCSTHKIVLTAYSPLGRGKDILLPQIQELAKKYECLPSQIILSWLFHKNVVAIPKSTHMLRIKENFESMNISLSEEDVEKINDIEEQQRLINPTFADFSY